jgi:hypothetical protein
VRKTKYISFLAPILILWNNSLFTLKSWLFFFVIAISAIPSSNLSAQATSHSNGNEWINYSRQYFYFPITENGVYRINYSALANSGFPVQTVNTANIQLFGKEREVPILIQDGGDGQLNQGDYIEFYAEKNDAWLDSLIFDDPDHLGNPNYSFYNDTLYYYLTWNNSFTNKRIQVTQESNFNSFNPISFVFQNATVNLTSFYYNGFMDNNGVTSSKFIEAEGWFGPRFGAGVPQHQDIQLPKLYNQSGASNLEVKSVVIGANNSPSDAVGNNHYLRVGYGNPSNFIIQDAYHGYQLRKYNFNVPLSATSSGAIRITHEGVPGTGINPDFQALGLVDVRYPRNLEFDGNQLVTFEVPFNPSQSRSLLNTTSSGSSPFIYVITQGRKIPLQTNGSFQSALVQNNVNGSVNRCVFASDELIKTVTQIKPVTNSGFFTNYRQANLSNGFIIISHPKLMSQAQAYANYRNLEYNALLVNVEELYHQYGGGVRKHAMAIRRFAKDLLETWDEKPRYLFLIGKAIRESRQGGGVNQWGTRTNPERFEENLVPTFGYPQSDALLTAGLDGTLLEQAIPTGRISARDASQVELYLNKVKEYEYHYNQDNYNPVLWRQHEWKKQVLHFGGGGFAGEQALFQSYLNGYKTIIEDTLTGKNVSSFFKETDAPISPSLANQVSSYINNGVSMMTFFGHASSDGFDQNIDNPNNYDNFGKYPILFANSCFTGNIHEPFYNSTSENYVIIANRGVIGFLATISVSYSSNLNQYSVEMYNNMAHRNHRVSIGENMKHTVQQIQGTNPNFRVTNVCHAFTFHGDPAISLYGMDTPDIGINQQSVSFSPAQITTDLESFDMQLVLTNVGKAFKDSFPVEVIRHLPSGDTMRFEQWVQGLHFKDTLTFTIPMGTIQSQGINRFDVFVDRMPQLQIEEIENVNNNEIYGLELFITSGDLIPVYPYHYAIVPDNQVTLKASTGDPFAPTRNYVLQLDTTDLYNSPLLQTHYVTQSGGVVTWEPSITLTDSTVYFWRASPDSSINNGYRWRESSFQYIPGRRGWGQAHFFQFKNNGYNQLDYNRQNRKFEFIDDEITLSCQVFGNANNPSEWFGTKWRLGLEDQEGDFCGTQPSIMVAVIDPVSFNVWESPFDPNITEFDFGQFNIYGSCRQRAEKYFAFRQDIPEQMVALGNMLENEIPHGHYVLVYTWRFANYDSWDNFNPQLRTIFQNMGAQQIGAPSSTENRPFIFYTRKGIPATAQEVYGEELNSFITFTTQLDFLGNYGEILAPVAGPAAEWKSLHWQYKPHPNHLDEEIRIQLTGIPIHGSNQLLLDTLITVVDSIDLSGLAQADIYPYLRLKASLRDENTSIAPQLMRWQLVNQPMPEAALNAHLNHTFHADTLQEGERLAFAIAIENISEFDMDSMLVSYQVYNKNNELTVIPYQRKDSLRVGEVIYDTIYFDTKGYYGLNRIRVEANPINYNLTPPRYDQLEQYRFNNIAEKNFYVGGDKMNPLLDVTFDGIHILDGDIVSSRPEITIRLNDENEFLLMNEEADTVNFKMWITDPDGYQRQIYFHPSAQRIGEYLDFYPAEDKDNIFRIEYKPMLEKDGKYKLLVQAQDKSMNASGRIDYSVTFEVYNTPGITEVLNYPNPFTTRTHFVFTLTGSEPPNQILIQIMTVTGRVVREITHHEIGPLRIGRNMTDFYWDGRDQFGDRLANGVYLYRVVAKLNNEVLEVRETSANKYFHRGIGKMVLMR